MNPLKQFRNYIISDALAKTDDVFERARIELIFGYSLFLWVMGAMFTGSVIAMHKTWEIYLTTCFAIPSITSMFIILKKIKNATYAGYMFLFMQLVMHIANGYIDKFEPRIDGVLWSVTSFILVFFVLGKFWGIGMMVFEVLVFSLGPLNRFEGNAIFNYTVPPEQMLDLSFVGVLIPLLLIIYAMVQIINTRTQAEKYLQQQKILLEKNNSELELQKRDVVASINYAKRIQYAVLPNEENIYRSIPLSFIYYKPRDIVSGDFFWFHEIDRDNYILVCADCTGHGVPGALMTVIGSNALSQIIVENKIEKPAEILVELDRKITTTLKQQKEHYQIIQDGMDLSLLKVDKSKKEFVFTSAKRPAIFIREKQLQEFKGSKNTLGGLRSGEKKFDEIKMNYEEDDIIYLFTDGITDQFGGTKNKKFTIKRFRELLLNIHFLPMHEQKQKVENEVSNWIGSNEQTDDINVIGIRF